MTATPLSMHVMEKMSLSKTGLVIQLHVVAMFLPSLITGKLIFSEHGLSPDKFVANIQNGIEFFYPKISGGCHANKDIPNLITNAKFNIDNLETMYLPGTQKFLGYNFWGFVWCSIKQQCC